MVIAYHVGRCHKKGKHNVRTVDYIKMDETQGSHDARVDIHKKVKSTVWGGLDKDRNPKADTEREAIRKVRVQNQIKLNHKLQTKEGTRRLLKNWKRRKANGTIKRIARKARREALKAAAESRRTFVEKYRGKKKLKKAPTSSSSASLSASSSYQSSGYASPPVSAGSSRTPSRVPSRAPSPPPRQNLPPKLRKYQL